MSFDLLRFAIGIGSSTVAYSMLASYFSENENEAETWRGKKKTCAASLAIGFISALISSFFPKEYFYPAVCSLAVFFSALADIAMQIIKKS